jgi:predicted metal-dependent HD superfamily phosphohydrolase
MPNPSDPDSPAAPDVPGLCAALVRAVEAAGGDRGRARATAAELLAAYAEPARAYHNRHHLSEVLGAIDLLAAQAGDLAAVRLAAWFHDAVYDPRAADNEERSAAWAAQALTDLGVPAPRVEAVRRLVLLTKSHRADGADADGGVLLDADLAILGAEEGRYRDYAAAIRREYDWVPEGAYRAGRARVLRGFLARGQIYHTAVMRARLEERARGNLASELRALEAEAG